MAGLNTQLGYQPPHKRQASAYAMPQAPHTPSSGVTRALAGVQPPPAAPSYASPYARPDGTMFQPPTMPGVQSQAPAGTPSTYTPQTPQAPQAPAGYSFDLETDPILQQMHAMAAKQRSDADSAALAQQKDLAIQYGDKDYGASIDPNTGAAAAQNPFSVTANLAHQYDTGTHNLDEQLNDHHLWYSGERIKELAAALRDYQQREANAAGSLQQGLGTIEQNRVAALMGADQLEQGAYNDAYTRALAAALGGGGGGGGATGFAPPMTVFGPAHTPAPGGGITQPTPSALAHAFTQAGGGGGNAPVVTDQTRRRLF